MQKPDRYHLTPMQALAATLLLLLAMAMPLAFGCAAKLQIQSMDRPWLLADPNVTGEYQ